MTQSLTVPAAVGASAGVWTGLGTKTVADEGRVKVVEAVEVG